MSTFARTITGIASTAFVFASLFNSQLSWNADRFYNEPAAFDGRLTEMHTNLQTGEFYGKSKEANHRELSRFFQLVK